MIVLLLLVIVCILLFGASAFIGGIGAVLGLVTLFAVLAYAGYLFEIPFSILIFGTFFLLFVLGLWAQNQQNNEKELNDAVEKMRQKNRAERT